MLMWDNKDPNEILDYQINWTAQVPGDDTIATSNWTITGSDTLAEQSKSIVGKSTIIWLTGGEDGELAVLTNRIVTTDGRTIDQSVELRIKQK